MLEESAEGLRGDRGGVAVARAHAEGDAGGGSGVEGADARLEGASPASTRAEGAARRGRTGGARSGRAPPRRPTPRGRRSRGLVLHRRGRHRREEGPRPRVVVAAAARVGAANVHDDGVAETRTELANRAGGAPRGRSRRRRSSPPRGEARAHATRRACRARRCVPSRERDDDVVKRNSIRRVPNRQRRPARERCRASPGRPRRSRRG